MNVKRFFGASSREAMKQIRAEMGDEAIILSNRNVDGGVEVIASTATNIAHVIDRTPQLEKIAPAKSKASSPAADPAALPTITRIAQAAQAKLSKAMSSVTPREPSTDRGNDSANARTSNPVSDRASEMSIPSMAPNSDMRLFKPTDVPAAESFAHFVRRSEHSRSARAAARELSPPKAASIPKPVTAPAPEIVPTSAIKAVMKSTEPDAQIINEIRHMKSILQEQIDALAWRERGTTRPLETKLIAQMLSAGFSPALARALANKLPADYSAAEASVWLQENLIRNISTPSSGDDMVERGGVYALVGPTGVGKTTTAAKLAARCVVKYGAKSLGLITVDSYRIGAEDQLRAYGKILGVPVHSARDAQSLADLISQMRSKHLVLIDTVGMGQRDSRLTEQLQMLSSPSIERVLFLNASAQGETLDDVVKLYAEHGNRHSKKVIVSKIDEAVKYGFVLDCLIRYKLETQYVTNGQRVPEDLHPASARYLVHCALKQAAAPAFALSDADIPLALAKASSSTKAVHIV